MATHAEERRVKNFGVGSNFSSNNPYDPTVVRERLGSDAFADMFGDYWNGSSNSMDLLQGALNFEAELGLRDYENEYNSPLQKVMRNREAGLNSDLLGLDGVSDSAATPASRLSNMEATSPIEVAQTVSSIGTEVLNNAMNIIDEIYGVENMSLSNESLRLSNDIDTFNLANGIDSMAFGDTVRGTKVFPKFGSDRLDNMYSDSRLKYTSDSPGLQTAKYQQAAASTSARRMMVDNLSQYGATQPDELYIGVQSELAEFQTGVQCYTEYLMLCSAASQLSRQLSDDELALAQNSLDKELLDSLDREKLKLVQDSELNSSLGFHKFQTTYYNTLDPFTIAACENAVAKYSKAQSEHDENFITSVDVNSEVQAFNAETSARFQNAATNTQSALNRAVYEEYQRKFFDKRTSDDLRDGFSLSNWIFQTAMGYQQTGFNPLSAGISVGSSMLAPYNSAAASRFIPRPSNNFVRRR